MISHTSKILLQIIKRRITPIVEKYLEDNQVGFRKGMGTRNGIYMLRTIGERRIEKGQDTYLTYIDYSKAFDKIQHNKLLQMLEEINVPYLERRLIKNIYFEQKSTIRCDGQLTDFFQIQKGVRQGCILSYSVQFLQ